MPAPKTVIAAAAVAFTAFAATHLLPLPGSVKHLTSVIGSRTVLDLDPSFSADAVYARLTEFGATGREIYAAMVTTTDVVFPAAVFGFLFLLARYVCEQFTPSRRLRLVLLWAPVIYFAADLAENAAIYAVLMEYPERNDNLAGAIGYLTVIKRVAQLAAVLLPLSLFFIREAKQLGDRR